MGKTAKRKAMSSEDSTAKYPDLSLANDIYQLGLSDELVPDKKPLEQKIRNKISENDMLPLYNFLSEKFKWSKDKALVERMTAANSSKIKELEERIKSAQEKEGESEVREASLAKANYLCQIGAKAQAILAYRETYEKTVAQGQRMDIVFALVRIGFFWDDTDLVRRNVEKAKT